MSVPNVPFGPGFDEANATAFATGMASLVDQLDSMSAFIIDTYSPFSSDEIANYWAASQTPPLDTPTPEMLAKANEFKSWIETVQTWVQAGTTGDVGYQIKKWRSATPFPPFR